MAAHEDGELEVVLGNKQLFAVLFVFVVLLGIFFALGFLAGRSTNDGEASAAATPAKAPAAVTEAEPVTQAESNPRPNRQVLPLVTDEQPATPPPAAPSPATKAAPEARTETALSAPPPGKYLQVAATDRKRDAEGMLEMLQKQGFKGLVTPSRRVPSLTAVLVGPFPTRDAIADAREKLKKLNIDKPFAVEYE